MDFDDLLLNQHDDDRVSWNKKLSQVGPAVCQLASKFRNNQSCCLAGLNSGSFNFCIKVLFEADGEEWMLRFPIPGRAMFAEQKLRNEVATMKYIKEKTTIPIPTVIAYGMAEDNPTGLGPFLITTFVQGTPLSEFLRADAVDAQGDRVLRSDIDDSTLEIVYRQIADVLLQLSDHNFDRIGSLSLDGNNAWSIGSGPLTLNMNELARCGDVDVGTRVFSTVADYLLEIAEQNNRHLERQRNSVDNALDARLKYTARHLFRAITPGFVLRTYNQGPFKLYCDDFQPGNILVDDSLKITGIIDWEWCYDAPYQFTYAPPRWLLLKEPAYWNSDQAKEDLLDVYLPKLELFLRILEEQEHLRLPCHDAAARLSSLMRQSMADMTFWFNEAARDSYALDRIYWSRLDLFCFGTTRNRAERSDDVCRADMHQGLEKFVKLKMEHLRQYRLQLGAGVEGQRENGTKSDRKLLKHDSSTHIPLIFLLAIPAAVMLASTCIIIQRQRR